MIEIEQFPKHLATLNRNNWEKLFALLPEIEAAKNFSEVNGREKRIDNALSARQWKSSEIVTKTLNVISGLNITPDFDWTNWQEGKTIIHDKNYDYSTLDTITLCKLLTTIIRTDRLNDGFLISCFREGIFAKIIKS